MRLKPIIFLLLGALLPLGGQALAAQDKPQDPPSGTIFEKPEAKPAEKPPEKPAVKPAIKSPEKKVVLEEIVARVNNEIITSSDLDRSKASLPDDVRQDCQGCTQAQIDAEMKDKEQNLLRDLIDQSLLEQKGKDLNINVEPDVIKQMDRVRQQNKFKDMDELEDALRKAGIVVEDYKNQIRNQLLTQEVIRKEVGSRVIVDHEEIQKYYDAHKTEFVRPETVYLREFFLSTENKPEAEIPTIETKAKAYLERIRKGEDFEEFAKRYSEGSTAKEGGFLGGFERGQLAKEIEDNVFKLKRHDITDVIRTKTGFLFLRVEEHFDAGQQPLDKVSGEIENRLYSEKMQPQLRKYLAQLREESYVVVKPGFVDSAAVASTPITEVEPSADTGKGGKKDKKSKKSKNRGAEAGAGKKAGI